MEDVEKDIMRGEFRGDFTRDTFNPKKNYSRVLMQQGRVQVDADWNEQVSIHLHYLRNLARDLGGPHWGPKEGGGFVITSSIEKNDFSIGKGRYYVNGILCEVGADMTYTYRNQPNYFISKEEKDQNIISDSGFALIYLDVWERHISYVEDDAIREVALGGPDTATRAKIIWQVKMISLSKNPGPDSFKGNYADFLNAIAAVVKPGGGKLQARAKDKSKNDTEPCLVAPESRYRGAENQLYRVEIHRKSSTESQATFKWSRENAAVIFPILERIDINESTVLSLEHLGRDERCNLKSDDWVEIVDDNYILHNRVEELLQVLSIDHENLKVTLKGKSKSDVGAIVDKHPYLRRWDQKTGDKDGIPVPKIVDKAPWIDLEDGIQISFPGTAEGTNYQSGDYWLIPARTITGDILWPRNKEDDDPQALLPHGVIHHYAPLATLDQTGNGNIEDLRRILAIPIE